MRDFRIVATAWSRVSLGPILAIAFAAPARAAGPLPPSPQHAHAILLDQLIDIANLLDEQGACREAEPLRRCIYVEVRRDPLSSACNRAAAAAALAATLAATGADAEALRLSQEAIEGFRMCGWPAVSGLAAALHGRGELLRAAENLDAAGKAHLEAVEIRRSALGREDPRTAISEIYLACVYQDEGRVDAVKQLEVAVDQLRRTRGDRDADYAWALGRFGSAVADATPDRARTLLRSAIEIERQLPRQKHPNLAADLFALGGLELRSGDPAAAEPLLLEALDIDLLRFGPNHLQTARTQSMLGEALTKLQRFKEAEPLLRAAYDTLVQKLPPVGPECTEARQRLIDYFDASGQSTMAEIYRTHP